MARGESALNVVAEEIRSGGGDVSVFVGDVSKVCSLILSHTPGRCKPGGEYTPA